MMRPVWRRSILATARLATRNEPVRLASMTSVKASSLMRSMRPSRVMPALATRTSTGPQALSMVAKAASTCSPSVTSHRTARKRSASAPSGGGGGSAGAVGGGHLVPVGEEPAHAGGADAAVAPGDQHDGHQVTHQRSGTRIQTRGWPSWTRSPAAASHPTTWPAKGVRTSVSPTRPTRSPTATTEMASASGPPSVPGSRPVPGARSDSSGVKMPLPGAHHHPLGHVEVLALVERGLGPPGAGLGDPVHQGVEVGRLGHGQRLDLGQAPLGQPAQHPAGPELDQGGEAQPGERLERLAPAHRAAELGRQEAGPVGRIVVHAGVDVGHHAHLGGPERDVGQGLAQRGACPLHERRVEGPGDRDGHDPLGAELLGQARRPRATASTVPAMTTWPGAL